MTEAEDKRVEEPAAAEAAPEAPMKITVVLSAQDSAGGAAAGDSAGEPAEDGPENGSSSQDSTSGASASGSAAPDSVGRRLTLAVTFLTGIPLKVEGEVSPSDLWGSMGWYPLVGLAMGFAAWVVYAGLDSFLPGLVAATLVVILLELLTRGLHLDGLMDTADGIFSGAPRERALEIMKDHNVGAMGVAAAVLLLVLKVAALGALARADAAAPLIAGLCAARALPALDVYHWPVRARRRHRRGVHARAHAAAAAAGRRLPARRHRRRRPGRARHRRRRLLVRRHCRRRGRHGRRARCAGLRRPQARRPHGRRVRNGHRTGRGGGAGGGLRHRRPGELTAADEMTKDRT